jgi:hypothetical protein
MTYTLTGEQLGELLELMADADSIELKLTVPESDHYSAAATVAAGGSLWITWPPYFEISGTTLSRVASRTSTKTAAFPGCSFSPSSFMKLSSMP